MRRKVLALALLLGGLGCCGAALLAWRPFGEAAPLVAAAGGVLAALGLAALVRSLAPGETRGDLLRLDVFLPFLRKRKKNSPPPQPGFALRLAQRVLPGWWSDPLTGKPGLVRRLLKRIGPSVESAPLRRAIQAACLGLFLVLFFYVCWPYTAAPDPPGRVSAGWRFVEIDAAAAWRFDRPPEEEQPFVSGQVLYLVDGSKADPVAGLVAPFEVLSASGSRVALASPAPLEAEKIDRVLLSPGPWSLHETEPGRWPSHYTDDLARKEKLPAEIFLVLDPLVSLSTAVAARSWVWSLVWAALILLVCVVVPRGFCGYLCPLGTLIDLFDWGIGRRVRRFRVADDGWWVHIKFYLLLAVMISAVCGVLISGYVAAIPVITRGLLFLGEPLQSGLLREWRLVPPLSAAHFFSIALFLGVLGLGLLKPRFWCKYVCPSGAVFSLGNLLRLTERKVESSCIHCNKCVEICPFDAIKPDFTTRTTDCTLCQTCGGVCPTHAIKFVERWNKVELKVLNDPPTGETALGRRGFLSLAAGTAAAVVGGSGLALVTGRLTAAASGQSSLPVRPPGSVPEREFLQMCIRCGECFKACPNNVLHPMGLGDGLNNLWTPQVVADWAGCEPSCNACGQVCPTGAIRALPLEEKRAARMGLAVVNKKTCLPYAGREACQLCVDECVAAGYDAIEFTQVHTQVDDQGQPIPGTGFLAPVVLAEKCVGCGICQTRCHGINVADKGLLERSAIIVEAGAGKEDRLMEGSYVELRQAEARRKAAEQQRRLEPAHDYFVPGAAPTRGEGAGSPDAVVPFGLDESPF